MHYAVGIDLGGSSVKAVAITDAGDVLQKHNQDFNPAREMDFANTIKVLLQRIQLELKHAPACVGVAAPGLASSDGLSIAYMPGRLEGLESLNWTRFLGLERNVPVLNDAQAALLGEGWTGAAKGMRNVIMITLGTGVGGAAIVDGRLLRGAIGRAGHLGHSCLDMNAPPDITGIPGSIEYLIGNYTIQERTGNRYKSTHQLIDAYRAGDAIAAKHWLESLRALACGISSYINILDPDAIILGGGIARAGRDLFEPLEKYLRPVEWQPGGHSVRLVPAQLGEFAGAIGSAKNALNQ